jgi:ribose-phosphate pyrophosphokinase
MMDSALPDTTAAAGMAFSGNATGKGLAGKGRDRRGDFSGRCMKKFSNFAAIYLIHDKTMDLQTPFLVFSGTKSQYLAEKICYSLKCPLGQMKIQHYADGEFSVSYEESIRGRDVFLVQSTFPNSDNLMELLLMIDAAKRASAHSIIAVVPYFGWARQDRKDQPRISIGAKLIADMLSTAGINRLITMDLHADQIQGFFDVPVDHLYASSVFLEHITELVPIENLVIATPDVGGTKRANSYAKYLGIPMVICHKARLQANEVAEMRIIGDVAGKDVLLVDDIVDTAGTITKAATLMMEHNAKSVRAVASHAVMSDPASARVDASPLKEIIFSDSIPFHKTCRKVKILSIADMFAEAIRRVCHSESISSLYVIK